MRKLARQSPAGNDVNTEADDIVGIRYQATTGEDAEDSMCAVFRSRVREVARALKFRVVTIYKCSVNPITSPNPVSGHLTHDSVYVF
jgi:hypothetical protein